MTEADITQSFLLWLGNAGELVDPSEEKFARVCFTAGWNRGRQKMLADRLPQTTVSRPSSWCAENGPIPISVKT